MAGVPCSKCICLRHLNAATASHQLLLVQSCCPSSTDLWTKQQATAIPAGAPCSHINYWPTIRPLTQLICMLSWPDTLCCRLLAHALSSSCVQEAGASPDACSGQCEAHHTSQAPPGRWLLRPVRQHQLYTRRHAAMHALIEHAVSCMDTVQHAGGCTTLRRAK